MYNTLRKIGGSTVLALPPCFLKRLNVEAGDEIKIEFVSNSVVITKESAPQELPENDRSWALSV